MGLAAREERLAQWAYRLRHNAADDGVLRPDGTAAVAALESLAGRRYDILLLCAPDFPFVQESM